MKNPICNTVFDSRDLIEYRDYLSEQVVAKWNELIIDYKPDFEVEDINEIIGTGGYEFAEDAEEYHSLLLETEEYEEWDSVNSFCEELSGVDDFEHGCSIIHETYFTDYCEELVKDCGYLSKDIPSWIEIDWESTADNIMVDYETATYESSTYYIR